jgi:hypothetical protein
VSWAWAQGRIWSFECESCFHSMVVAGSSGQGINEAQAGTARPTRPASTFLPYFSKVCGVHVVMQVVMQNGGWFASSNK